MTDATKLDVAATTSPASLTPPPATSHSMSLRKRRHRDISEDVSQPAAGTSSTISPLQSTSSLTTDPTTVSKTASGRFPSTLTPIDTTPSTPNISTGSLSHPPPPSPVPTEIVPDLEQIQMTPEDHIAALLAEGIKVRDFVHEPVQNSCKAPEVFDPLPSLIATDWHMRNPRRNHGMLSGKALFRLIKIGWLTLADVTKRVHVREFSALVQYSERPEEERYPFVVVPKEPMPTPSRRVRMRCSSGFPTHADDVPDRVFFGYDPTGHSDDEHPPPRVSPEAEREVATAQAEEPKAKRRKVKSKTKRQRRAKPLRRETSRPEV
jgi:hypothetical protein